MRKKIILIALAVLLLAAVLFVPIPGETYEDGGTREYTALTYTDTKNRLPKKAVFGTLKRTLTSDLPLRRRPLYTTELSGHILLVYCIGKRGQSQQEFVGCRGREIGSMCKGMPQIYGMP